MRRDHFNALRPVRMTQDVSPHGSIVPVIFVRLAEGKVKTIDRKVMENAYLLSTSIVQVVEAQQMVVRVQNGVMEWRWLSMAQIARALLRIAEASERHESAARIMLVVGNHLHPVGCFGVRQVCQTKRVREIVRMETKTPKRCTLTELDPIWCSAGSRVVLVVLDGLPDVPAAKVIDDIALRVLDLVPLKNVNSRLVDEAGNIEDFSEGDNVGIATDVGGREHGYNRDALGERAKVYQVGVSHNVVG